MFYFWKKIIPDVFNRTTYFCGAFFYCFCSDYDFFVQKRHQHTPVFLQRQLQGFDWISAVYCVAVYY